MKHKLFFLTLFAGILALSPIAHAGDLGGYYRGLVTTTNSDYPLPERMTLGLVVTSEINGELKVTGRIRFYQGDFDSTEYIEPKTESIQYNTPRNTLTIRASAGSEELTFVLRKSPDDFLKGTIYSDSLGKVAEVVLFKKSK